AVRVTVSVDPELELGSCAAVLLDFSDVDGGALPPPDVTAVRLFVPGADVFTDSRCMNPWPAAGQPMVTASYLGTLRPRVTGPLVPEGVPRLLLVGQPTEHGAEPPVGPGGLEREQQRLFEPLVVQLLRERLHVAERLALVGGRHPAEALRVALDLLDLEAAVL